MKRTIITWAVTLLLVSVAIVWAGWKASYTELAATPATDDAFLLVDVNDTTMAATGTTKWISFDNMGIPDLVTLSGVVANSEHLGEFTGSTITDNQTIKAALQLLETSLETKESATSNNIDPDRLNGDTTDDNLLDPVIGGTGADTSSMTGLSKMSSGVVSVAAADTDYAVARLTKGLTMQAFADQDATPDVTGGGTGILGNFHLWQTANTVLTTITDFDDTDNHTEFAAGDWFVLRCDDDYTKFDCSANANFECNLDVDFTCTDEQPRLILWIYDGSKWYAASGLNSGESAPGVLAISAIDLGGATSLEIPNGTDPNVDAAGEITQDTDGANVTGDVSLRGYDGTNQFLIARKLKCIHATAIKPQDWADAARDLFVIWENTSGMTFTVASWSGKSGTDNTTLAIMERDADGANSTTVDAVELATDGTNLYYGSDETITAATIEAGHILALDFDDTDDPAWVKMTICGWYNADVD